jgi:hypothetical protein
MSCDIERFHRLLAECWKRSEGRAWEPPRIKGNPFFDWAVKEGYLRVVNGRCGFEAFKDSMVTWTDAGRTALSSHRK